MQTKVLVADEREVTRVGLESILQGDCRYEVCGEAIDGLGAAIPSLFLYNEAEAPVHSQSAGSLLSLWLLGIVCGSIGVLFVYKAFASKGSRTVNVDKTMATASPASPRWLARSLSFLLGVTFIALGVVIVIRLLEQA